MILVNTIVFPQGSTFSPTSSRAYQLLLALGRIPCWEHPWVQRAASVFKLYHLVGGSLYQIPGWGRNAKLGPLASIWDNSEGSSLIQNSPLDQWGLSWKPQWGQLLCCQVLPSSLPQRYLSPIICMQLSTPESVRKEPSLKQCSMRWALSSKCNCAIYNIITKFITC